MKEKCWAQHDDVHKPTQTQKRLVRLAPSAPSTQTVEDSHVFTGAGPAAGPPAGSSSPSRVWGNFSFLALKVCRDSKTECPTNPKCASLTRKTLQSLERGERERQRGRGGEGGWGAVLLVAGFGLLIRTRRTQRRREGASTKWKTAQSWIVKFGGVKLERMKHIGLTSGYSLSK